MDDYTFEILKLKLEINVFTYNDLKYDQILNLQCKGSTCLIEQSILKTKCFFSLMVSLLYFKICTHMQLALCRRSPFTCILYNQFIYHLTNIDIYLFEEVKFEDCFLFLSVCKYYQVFSTLKQIINILNQEIFSNT